MIDDHGDTSSHVDAIADGFFGLDNSVTFQNESFTTPNCVNALF